MDQEPGIKFFINKVVPSLCEISNYKTTIYDDELAQFKVTTKNETRER